MSKSKFTDGIFYDGIAWNLLMYDANKNQIEFHYIINNNTNDDAYHQFVNLLNKNVRVELTNDCLYLFLDYDNCIIELFIEETKTCCFTSKKIISFYKYLPTNTQCIVRFKLSQKIDKVGNEDWDKIADFLNKSV